MTTPRKRPAVKTTERSVPDPEPPRITLTVPNTRNSIPELVELKASLQAANEEGGKSSLGTFVRVQNSEIELLGEMIDVAVQELTIQVTTDGCAVSDQGRFGEPVRNNEVEIKRTEDSHLQKKTAVSGEGSSKLGLMGFAASIKGTISGSREKRTDVKTSVVQKDTHLVVMARGGDRWQVKEFEGQLDGTYASEKPLCLIERNPGSNRTAVNVFALVKERDLTFDVRKLSEFAMSNNKEKLIKAFIAKCMSTHKETYRGFICLSETEISDEG